MLCVSRENKLQILNDSQINFNEVYTELSFDLHITILVELQPLNELLSSFPSIRHTYGNEWMDGWYVCFCVFVWGKFVIEINALAISIFDEIALPDGACSRNPYKVWVLMRQSKMSNEN